jgi:soluble lytic murein transglycosylase
MRILGGLRPMVLYCLILGALVVLTGCANPPPTPRPLEPTATVAESMAVAGATPAPSRTPAPSVTATNTVTPSPTPTPSPTLPPTALLEQAQQHQHDGDYDLAIDLYLALLGEASPGHTREARYCLAETYLLNRDYGFAADAWERFLADYPDDERLASAHLMAARAYRASNQCPLALPHYEAALTQETVLGDLVNQWIGDCRAEMAANAPDREAALQEVIAAYEQALQASRDQDMQAGLREKLAGIYLALGDHAGAVAQYDAILRIARIDAYQARIEYQAAQALAADGQVEAAHTRYRRAVNAYPEAEYAYYSLIALVDAGVAVDEFQRGMVDYYAGAEHPDAYEAAIHAFDRYLADATAKRPDEALYYKALSERGLERPDAALETLEALIAGHPESEWLAEAWLQKGAILAAKGEPEAAVKVFRDLAAFFPGDELAPEALWRAARQRDIQDTYAEAGELYEQVQAAFPGYDQAEEALWRAGLAYYRAGELEKATAAWRALVEKYPDSSYRPGTLYWLGKVQPRLEGEQADWWDRLLASEPNDFHALRVQQIRSGDSLTVTRLISTPVTAPTWDAGEYEAEILDWLQTWTEVPTSTHLINLPARLAGRYDLRRGEALLAAGLRTEALAAYDTTRKAMADDPVALAQLSVTFRERELYGEAVRCALRLAALWPEGNLYRTPVALQRLAYPLAYDHLLSAAAQKYNLDPMLLAALVRQESLFEKAAESYAGARGLGQVMPATGEGIARSLGMEDFDLEDLYRPVVSIEFGAFYLAAQMKYFDNQLLVALAAYNGGPGNALRWLEATGEDGDLDLFIEVITANQSRVYLRSIYQQYLVYERLYRSQSSEEVASR